MFISANYRKREDPEVPTMPGTVLCRFEFLEIIVRIAREKYFNLKEPILKSIERLLEEHIKPYCELDNCQEWRE